MRSYNEINKGRAQYIAKATKFYEGLAQRAIQNCHCIDVFSGSFDQTGLVELRECVHNSGGYMYTVEEFDSECFRKVFLLLLLLFLDLVLRSRSLQSMERIFAQNAQYELLMGFNGHLEIQTSAEWKISGAIGPCVSTRKASASVGEVEIGESKTCAWRMCGVAPDSTVAVYFEVVTQVLSSFLIFSV